MARVQTMVQLTSELVAHLDEAASDAGVSRSEVIRRAIETYLAASREHQITAALVAGYSAVPQGAIDEWGDVRTQLRSNTQRVLERLDQEEEAAGLGW